MNRVTKTQATRMRKGDLVDLLMKMQEGGEKSPLWEIRSLVNYKYFFPVDGEDKDIKLEPGGTAIIPEHMRHEVDIKKAVQAGYISEPYQVDEPTPPKIPPIIPESLRLERATDREAVRNILACNDIGVKRYIRWGTDIAQSKLKRREIEVLKYRILPILQQAEYIDSQTGEMEPSVREELHSRIERIEAM